MFVSHACYLPCGLGSWLGQSPLGRPKLAQASDELRHHKERSGSLLRLVGACSILLPLRCPRDTKPWAQRQSSGTSQQRRDMGAQDLELQQRLAKILQPAEQFLSSGLVDRGLEAKLLLLAALAGEHLLLIGPPGTAKSLLARRLAELGSASYFERLLTRFSTPDEVFGPLSLKPLQEDRLERRTERYLPEAEVAFLDEVFKANSAILNALLTLLNERVFDNGSQRCSALLWCAVGASNEMPAQGELDALFDRFLLKRFVNPVSDVQAKALLTAAASSGAGVAQPSQSTRVAVELSAALGREVRAAASRVAFPARLLQTLARLRQHLQEEEPPVHISDRRLAKAAQLVQIVAFTSGACRVSELDLLCLQYVLWDRDPEMSERIRDWLLSTFAPKAAGGEVGDIQVEGAGRSDMDGIYEFVGDRDGKRWYQQRDGQGAIYFDLFWKLCDGSMPGGPGNPPWYQSIEDMTEVVVSQN